MISFLRHKAIIGDAIDGLVEFFFCKERNGIMKYLSLYGGIWI